MKLLCWKNTDWLIDWLFLKYHCVSLWKILKSKTYSSLSKWGPWHRVFGLQKVFWSRLPFWRSKVHSDFLFQIQKLIPTARKSERKRKKTANLSLKWNYLVSWNMLVPNSYILKLLVTYSFNLFYLSIYWACSTRYLQSNKNIEYYDQLKMNLQLKNLNCRNTAVFDSCFSCSLPFPRID